MNVVAITGRVGRAPEKRPTTSGQQVVTFSIAVDRKDKSGNKVTDWFNCTAFGRTGDLVMQYFGQGAGIEVVGSLQTRSYEKDGKTVTVTLIIVDSVGFPKGNNKPDDKPFEV